MDRLSIYLTFMTGSVLVGGLVIAALALGYYTWPVILGCIFVGMVLSWPAAYVISRAIKRNDANWDETAKDRTTEIVPKPGAPEV